MMFVGAGEIGMRKIWAVLVAISFGMALGACSKCDMPTYGSNSCHGGVPAQTLAGLLAR
jgi:hypothetical protein